MSDGREAATVSDFDALVGPVIEPGYRLAVTMLRDPQEARDAVQEAAVSAWRSIGRLREPAHARSWFLSIVANQCRSTMRRRWWGVIRVGGASRVATDPQDSVVQSVDIDRAISRLSPEDRAVLHLHFFQDLPLDEIGRVLGISEGAAKGRVYRAAHRLRADLSEEDI